LDSEIANGVSTLASWTTSPKNPTFAKAIVNRLWKQMMGRGLVEPVDDFRATNPATHPELLNQLANDFIAHGYSLRHTLRRIASSEAYGRTADATKRNKNDDRFYSHALRRPLEPEVLADAISDVLGLPDRYGEHPAGTRAIELRNPKTDSTSLEILGRCDRQTTCETAAPTGSLPQKLHFLNGPLLNARIDAPGSRLRRMLSENHSPIEIVKRYYVIALGRPAKANEVAHWDTTINPLKTEQERREFLIDFVWGLLTCEEFTTNH